LASDELPLNGQIFCCRFFSPKPLKITLGRVISNFLRKFAEIFASQGAPNGINNTSGKFATSVNSTGGKFATGTTGVVDISGKFATSVNDTGAKLPLVLTTLAANLPSVSTTPVANGNNIRLQTS
jgi:hypothetical protein